MSAQQVVSPTTLNNVRIGFSRTHIGQNVQANIGPDAVPVRARRAT